MVYKYFFLIVFRISFIFAIPIPCSNNLDGENGNKFEGDMILNKNQLDFITKPIRRRNLGKYIWPNGSVYYYINEKHFNESQIHYILKGMRTIALKTCIRFYPWSKGIKDYINITAIRKGCDSKVGRAGGMQILNLQPTKVETQCFRLGSIIHEFMHALGFYHQHSEPDRDLFIKIITENIRVEQLKNFNKHNSTISDYHISYDYESLMHYSSTAFSKNGLKTIETLDDVEIGQRKKLSEKDIQKINLMYKCKKIQ